jgi:predicted nucleotidyltransferase component of viral defense system
VLRRDNPYFRQVELLVALLPRIAGESAFALKGGTAINLFLRDMPRLSVDIDLVYLPREPREESLDGIRSGFQRIAKRIENELPGARAIPGMSGGSLTKLNVQRGPVRVKIEVSPVLRGAVEAPIIFSIAKSVEETFGYAEFPLLHSNEIYAGKICAALDRQHPRDFFDVGLLLKDGGLEGRVVEAFVVYMISGDRPFAEMLDPKIPDLGRVFEDQFFGMTLQPVTLLDLEKARTELLHSLHQKLTDKHRRFLVSFKLGDPKWELLDYQNIADLPAIRWKAHNLAKMDKDKRQQAVAKLEKVLANGPRPR